MLNPVRKYTFFFREIEASKIPEIAGNRKYRFFTTQNGRWEIGRNSRNRKIAEIAEIAEIEKRAEGDRRVSAGGGGHARLFPGDHTVSAGGGGHARLSLGDLPVSAGGGGRARLFSEKTL